MPTLKDNLENRARHYTPVIPALRKLRQEDHKFEASLDYILRLCFQKEEEERAAIS
jgi:hypothetical protein